MNPRHHVPARLAIIAGFWLSASLLACQSSQPASGSAPSSSSKPVPSAGDPVVDRILDRLETRDVRDLHARIRWEIAYPLDEDVDARLGELWYREDEPTPKFKAHFRERITGNRSDKGLDEQHLFDGRYLIELNSAGKTVTRREVRRPDDKSNPFKLGEGSFPVPFGQKKADILREFDVARVAEVKSARADADQLRLTPKPGSAMARDFQSLDFWVAREGRLAGLPVKVSMTRLSGTGEVASITTVTFDDVELNGGLGAGVFRIETPPGYLEIDE